MGKTQKKKTKKKQPETGNESDFYISPPPRVEVSPLLHKSPKKPNNKKKTTALTRSRLSNSRETSDGSGHLMRLKQKRKVLAHQGGDALTLPVVLQHRRPRLFLSSLFFLSTDCRFKVAFNFKFNFFNLRHILELELCPDGKTQKKTRKQAL